VQRFPPEKVVQMRENLSQHKEIMEAGLEGLVECPFCYFVVVIDNEEKLFSCRNEKCRVVSCRVCKRSR
jgi:TRIAD3 protein (E3 ubiquitin-protein ligase RNF216)